MSSFRGRSGTLIVSAAAFVLVAGVGAAVSLFAEGPPTGPEDVHSFSNASGSNDEVLSRLTNYTQSIASQEPERATPTGELLPDVDTMVQRLAARLETSPEDIAGWRMLGWSYVQMGRYDEAATAYAKAVALDPNSADLKLSYEEAKSKASGHKETAGPAHPGHGPGIEAKPQDMAAGEREAAIRSMVDGLADRLERSPRDVDGWSRLMRSRVVLGEKEVAVTAFRKALDVFKDDSEASSKITAAATELGLKVE